MFYYNYTFLLNLASGKCHQNPPKNKMHQNNSQNLLLLRRKRNLNLRQGQEEGK
jgi:hypothetical protein